MFSEATLTALNLMGHGTRSTISNSDVLGCVERGCSHRSSWSLVYQSPRFLHNLLCDALQPILCVKVYISLFSLWHDYNVQDLVLYRLVFMIQSLPSFPRFPSGINFNDSMSFSPLPASSSTWHVLYAPPLPDSEIHVSFFALCDLDRTFFVVRYGFVVLPMRDVVIFWGGGRVLHLWCMLWVLVVLSEIGRRWRGLVF